MTDDIKIWLKKAGKIFLDEVGIKEGDILLDFGCGEGHYTIPSAKLVGEKGRVYALDKDGEVLDELMKIAKVESLENIEPIKTSGELKIPLEDDSVDVVLLYDVLHYMDERRELIDDIYRVMKLGGILSVYPKHHSSDSPLMGLANLSLEDIIREIEEVGFQFEKRYFKRLVHDDNYNKGYILKFRKRDA
jgi:ubiquinone/menaquinone biosynthesis C-methylase UbiE